MAHAESGDFVPTDLTQEALEGNREYARYLADDFQTSVRRIWPDHQVEDMPPHITDDEIYTWMAGGYTVQYLPDRRVTPEVIRYLEVRFDDSSLDFLARCSGDVQDAFQLTGGWKLVENTARTVQDMDKKRGLDETIDHQLAVTSMEAMFNSGPPVEKVARVYQLLHDTHEVASIRRRVTTAVRLPKAIELLVLRNLATPRAPGVERELCMDYIPGDGAPDLLSLQHYGDESRVVPFKTLDQYSGGIRRVWDIPQILRA